VRASWSHVLPFGVARRTLLEPTPLEAWLESVADAAARSFDVGPEQVALSWEVVGWQDGLEEADQKALALLVLASLVTQSRGSTRLPVRGAAGRAVLEKLIAGLVPQGEVAGHLTRIVRLIEQCGAPDILGGPEDRRPLLVEGDHLYHEKLLRAEVRFAESMADRLSNVPAPAFDPARVDEALADVLARPAMVGDRPIELSTEQRRAVLAAAARPLSVVSGGPGTGKTSIVVSILRVLSRLGIAPHEIALAAPTGKAAQRLGESISKGLSTIRGPAELDRQLVERRPEPQTIHRLLGTSADGSWVKHHEGNRLEQRIVIIDEASMIDLHLIERLVRAVRPDARLVILGDARQLPSVGAGAVLRDLIDAPALEPYAVRLTKNYRMNPDDPSGRAILSLARRISPESGGAAEALEDALVVRAAPDEVAFDRAEALFASAAPLALTRFLERWYAERIAGLDGFDDLIGRAYDYRDGAFDAQSQAALAKLFAHYERSRLLCVTRVAKTGAKVVNETFRALHRARRKGKERFEQSPGEPVLMLVNDYEKRIWNGDQGVALWVRAEDARPRLAAVFRSGASFVPFPVELLRGQLDHCFAMTVHKSQGAEFDHVALVLPDRDMPHLLTREILYTAITRARKSVVIVGGRDILAAGAARTIERFSGAGERIASCATRGRDARPQEPGRN
jgi:exodeoxyribonuclease V alpha subunit